MDQKGRVLRAKIPKIGLGLGSAVRRLRQLHGMGQETLAETSGLSQSYLSQIESGAWTAVSEETLGQIAAALGVEPWVILAKAAGLRLDQVERLSEEERVWLDVFRLLKPEQRKSLLEVAIVMKKPSRSSTKR